ncbi:uncharacterized protein SPAPADRAFT_59527 [Spathaspora passalidarum NRRL Y-27907]|uniref:Retrograde transport protein Dsl1 C-terminal domain-containing protein n=1 Tax=Spathaspora passalidarum (strain NRRL Y-27907 / 11-Y1) TaxID=619300 RepID=G3AHE5_SPAPN|nr:uncharacterized protein SPAPADRAFT_59527 [Spathaspora passalidarum NRRL Y-27907]EGW34107.1 hypothetical protein SPAPADRAFT_59527 [Spathaspora passalidarum NRRL Y-27907]
MAQAVQAPVQEEETIEEEETDGWNDNWDDAWDENEEEEEETKSTQEDDWNAKWDNSDQEEEEEEAADWNDKWDDNWDDESDKEEVLTKKSPKKIVKAKEPPKEAIPQEKTVVEPQVKQKVPEKILISQISIKVIDIFHDYQLDRKYLVSTIKALSSVVYPPLTNSFLMINDLNYLQANLDLPLQSFIQTNWNQVIVEFYSKIKTILATIDLSDEESETSVDLLDKWFKNLDKQLYTTNPNKLKHLITDIVEFINNWLINSIIDLDDISEFQCTKLTQIIDSAHDITSSYIKQIGISTSLASYNKLANVRFMINNHITAIIARFYQGDLYDLTTDEIIKLIKSVFIQSELREDTINEIIEFRNMN